MLNLQILFQVGGLTPPADAAPPSFFPHHLRQVLASAGRPSPLHPVSFSFASLSHSSPGAPPPLPTQTRRVFLCSNPSSSPWYASHTLPIPPFSLPDTPSSYRSALASPPPPASASSTRRPNPPASRGTPSPRRRARPSTRCSQARKPSRASSLANSPGSTSRSTSEQASRSR